MLLKKPIGLCASSLNSPISGAGPPLSCITSPRSGSGQWPTPAHLGQCTTGLSGRATELTRVLECKRFHARGYAFVSGPSPKYPSGAATEHSWPTSRHPTPYEILAHPRDAHYDKALFYKLVKIYHPDRNHTAAGPPIPQSVRLERYRLVVAANEILSNDAKRRAYDLYGAGWDGNHTLQDLYREADRSWRNEPGNPSRNATWEDWERWRRERNGETQPQTPVFMSNELFVMLLCCFVVVGSFAQARRASTTTLDIVEMRDQKHAAINDDLRRRQTEQAPLSRDERVQKFLRQRDSWNLGSSGDRSVGSAP